MERDEAEVTDVRWKTVPETGGRDRKRSVADGGQPSASNGQRY